MRATRTVEISTGLFVLLGFAALFFLVTQITNRELSIDGNSYEVTAMFENIGSLKPGAAVSMAGVTVGRVETIGYDQQQYKAVVRMRINSQFDRIPKDTTWSVRLRTGCPGLQPCLAEATCSETSPRSVNFKALESKFFNTC